MALSTNYRRNMSGEDISVKQRMERAKTYAEQFKRECGIGQVLALDLGARVILGRITVDQVYESYPAKQKGS